MPDVESLLQERLAALEAGQPLETLLSDLPDEQRREMESLLRLAAVLREMPHPLPLSDHAAAQRAEIMAAAEIHTQPLPKTDLWSQPAQKTQPVQRPQPVERKRRGWLWNGGLSFGAVAAVLLCLGLAVVLSLARASGQGGAQARLENLRGQVQVASGARAEDWKTASEGDILQAGQRLRTLDSSSVTLVFFEGTRTSVNPGSELTLTRLSANGKNGLQAELAQAQGNTSHNVVPLQGRASFFKVTTPAGQASVHGTRFAVRVAQNGQTLFSVNAGEVRVQNEDSEVTLLPGQITASEPGQPPAAPAYQFNAQGSLLDNEGSTWAVSGATFAVNELTYLDSDLQLGEAVTVSGRVLTNSQRVADRVERTNDTNQATTFTGTLETMQDDTWMVSGIPLTVTVDTHLAGELNTGKTVRVAANILNNGNWLALSIIALDEEEPLAPAPTATVQASSTPASTSTSTLPTATATQPAAATTIEPGTAQQSAESCPGSDPHPTGQTLAQRYGVPYEDIMAWFCQNYGFGEIELAYSLSQESGMPVEQVFELHASGMSWGEMKKQLAPDSNEKENQGEPDNPGNPGSAPGDNDKDKDKDKPPKKNP